MLSTSQTPIRGEYNCKGDDSLFLNSLEKVLKGSLDYIPSPLPSLKIQIIGGKVGLRFKNKIFLVIVNKLPLFEIFSTLNGNSF